MGFSVNSFFTTVIDSPLGIINPSSKVANFIVYELEAIKVL